jgi:hypothetical protein
LNKIIVAIPIAVIAIAVIAISISLESEIPSVEINASVNQTVTEILEQPDTQTDDKKQTENPLTIIQPSYETITELEHDKILNKTIPPNYEFGNSFLNLLQNGQIYSDIEKENQKASIRFTNQYEGMLEKITLRLLVENNSTAIAGIQLDDGQGNPDGQWLKTPSEILPIDKGSKARHFVLSETPFLEKNKIYHIVLEQGTTLTTSVNDIETITILHYRDNAGGYPFNPLDPDIYLPDPHLNSLFFDGISWKVLDRWPSFLLTFEDGHKEGQPYTLAAPWRVSDHTYVGQTIIPHSKYNVSEFSFVVGVDGKPTEPLYYGIQDYEGNILDSGIIARADELSWGQNLATVKLEDLIKMDSGKLYRYYVYSPIPRPTNHTDFYEIYGQEFSFDFGLTYGGLIHRLTISHDFGKTWTAWNDADTIFKIKTK